MTFKGSEKRGGGVLAQPLAVSGRSKKNTLVSYVETLLANFIVALMLMLAVVIEVR